MAISFPPSPLRLQLYTYDGVTYIWTGSEWKVYVLKNTNNSFNKIQIDGREQFDAFSYRDINFQGINVNIFSADTNTLVFSAQQMTNSVISVTESNNSVVVVKGDNTSTTFTIDAVTGGSYSNGVITFSGTGNVNGVQINGFSSASSFTGGTVNGPTNFTNGLTANTISATTVSAPTITTSSVQNTTTFRFDIDPGSGIMQIYNSGYLTKFYPSGQFEIPNNILGGTFGGNQVQLGSSATLAGLRNNEVFIQTGTGGTADNTFKFGANTFYSPAISASTYQNLPTDIRVTGASYSNNTFTYTNNTGGTFNVLFNALTGLTVNGNLTVTGNTSLQALTATSISATTYSNLPTDITITGATYSNNTFTYTNNTGGTFSVLFNTITGLTVNGGLTITGTTTTGTISATTYQNLPTDIRTTGGTYSNNTFTFTNNTGGTYSVLFNTVTGLTVNGGLTITGTTTSGTISATTYQNLPTDVRVTGSTYSNNNFTFTNNTGGTFSVLFNTVTGLTVNGGLTITGNTSAQGLTATTISATTYQNLPTDIRVTGATYSNNTFTYTNNTGGTFNVLFNTLTGLTVNGNLSVTGTTSLGNGTFTKSGSGRGDVLVDNNSTDTPGVLFYYANNSNYGIDSWNATFDVLSGQLFRVTNNLNESGGAVKMAIDTSGNMVVTGFVKPSAWRAGQVVNDIMLSNTEVTISTTTVATSTSDTDFLTYSYTPLSSSSYLVIHYHLASFSFEGGTGNDSYFSRIKVDGSEITYSRQSTVNGNRTGVLFPLTGRYTNSNTTAKSIVVACRRDSADDSITIVNSSSSMWLRITEIAR